MPKAIDPERKARILGDIRAGMGVTEASRKWGVNAGTLCRWRDADTAAVEALPTEKKQARLDLAEQATRYIEDAFITLRTHLRLARESDWFNRQSADAIATFDGVHYDKVARTLAAFQRDSAAGELGRDDPAIIDGEAGPAAFS